MSDVSGVSGNSIDAVTKKLDVINSNLKKCFDDMESIFQESVSYMQSVSCNAMRNKFSNISSNFSIINSNLELYIKDLKQIDKNHKNYTYSSSSVEFLDIEGGGDLSGVGHC